MQMDLQRARRYAAGGHKSVIGWLAPQIATTLISLAAEQGRLGIHGGAAEIGVYHGKVFVLLCLLLRQDEDALGIDLFGTDAGNSYGTDIEERLRANLEHHGVDASRVKLLAGNSMTMDTRCVLDAIGPVRIFSVDGGHSAEETEHDLEIGAGSVVDGGLVVLDDYFNTGWPAVAEGACRFMARDARLKPVAVAGNRFIFARGRAEEYRRALQGPLLEVFGNPVVIVPPNTLRARLKATPLWGRISHSRTGYLARRALGWLR